VAESVPWVAAHLVEISLGSIHPPLETALDHLVAIVGAPYWRAIFMYIW
jgi:hypothetical protein